MSIRGLLVIALCTVGPSAAGAQFTTFIPPKNKVEDSIKKAVVAETKARSDSITAAALTNMKTWVDSASGVTVPPVPADSMVKLDSLGRLVSSDTVMKRGAPTFREGSVAPHTASALPFLMLLGSGMIGLGATLTLAPARKRRRRPGA